MAEYAMLDKGEEGYINLKKIGNLTKPDFKSFICFYMDPSFIATAMKTYPSTYNKNTGKMLVEYNKDRMKFLEDQAKKEAKEGKK
jgi:hypothetical protein